MVVNTMTNGTEQQHHEKSWCTTVEVHIHFTSKSFSFFLSLHTEENTALLRPKVRPKTKLSEASSWVIVALAGGGKGDGREGWLKPQPIHRASLACARGGERIAFVD